MSLAFPALDDTALEALANKGVVRRARRDLGAGLAAVTEHGEESARVQTDGQTVSIDARGPQAARCTCPAVGICRHVVIAVMALNAARTAPAQGAGTGQADAAPRSEEPPAADVPAAAPGRPALSALSALAELCALTQADLEAFARAGWPAACALAAASLEATVVENAPHCTVTLPDAPAPVTFIAGQGLAGAVCKAPKARARILVTAAAVVARARQGIALELSETQATEPDGAGLSQESIEEAASKLAQSVRSVLVGAAPIAVDILFDLAISARAEAVPRLTAELRRLARHARLAASRDVRFEPAAFVVDAARAFALLEALKTQPRDLALTGVPRRDYRASAAFDVWLLGAATWRTDSGARGLTMHTFCPLGRRWHPVSIARGPGMDPFFDPRAAYKLPLWGAGQPGALMGSILHLPQPLVADDDAIALTLPSPAQPRGRLTSLAALLEAGAAFNRWEPLRADLHGRLGAGLRRRASPAPVLIAPACSGELSFNDFSEEYEWVSWDESGDRLLLSMAAEDAETARRVVELPEDRLILAETAGTLERPSLRPIAILQEKAEGMAVINLRLEPWARSGSDAAARRTQIPTPAVRPPDLLSELAQRAIDAAVESCAGAADRDSATLARECETAGLLSLAAMLEPMSTRRDVPGALAVAYLASEIMAVLGWRG